ncbi:hypothetical protein PL78_09275 [Yersinia entomophaga]|uniref:Uncharacterized protein n=1 Tax=Yersinia entomophaga TaxID=935293 RepID=A0ABM6BKR8_YERET|nr:hypothetical protein [Yersinia entomophaga]ANI30009.1 hypothetical protein PL78_09275 [Yersinia entomophaga]OWF87108.1 hypothetical protein B4914_12870 [Yersinia entomophaga]
MPDYTYSFIGVLLTTLVSFLAYRRSIFRDKYKFDEDLINAYKNKSHGSRYLVERVFFYKTKCMNVGYREIDLLLRSNNSGYSIFLFENSKRFVNTCYIDDLGVARFAKKFDSFIKRILWQALLFICYLSLVSLWGFLFLDITENTMPSVSGINLKSSEHILNLLKIIINICIMGLSMLFVFRCVASFVCIHNCKEFVEHFNKNSKASSILFTPIEPAPHGDSNPTGNS